MLIIVEKLTPSKHNFISFTDMLLSSMCSFFNYSKYLWMLSLNTFLYKIIFKDLQ